MPAHDSLLDALLPTLGAVRRTLRRVAGSAVSDDALTAAEREVVLLVGRRPGRPVSEVAQELGLAPNTVSTIVSRLVTRGLVVRATDPDDRRIGRLSLTAAAQGVRMRPGPGAVRSSPRRSTRSIPRRSSSCASA